MKKLISVLLALTMILALVACGGTEKPAETPAEKPAETPAETPAEAPANDYKPVKLVASSQFVPADPFNTEFWVLFEELVAEKTDGKLTFDYQLNAALGGAAEQLEIASTGMADIAICTTALFKGQLPISYLTEFPAFVASTEAGSQAMTQFLQEGWADEEYSKLGLIPLGMLHTGEGGISLMDHPIDTLAGFKGHELRGNAMNCEVTNLWGGTGVYIATNETYEAMRSGIVTGAVLGAGGHSSLTLDTICEYYTYLPVFSAGFLAVMNQESFDKLPAEWQTALLEAFDEAFDAASWCADLGSQKTYQHLKERGIEVDVLTDEEYAEMESIAASMGDAYAAELDAQGLKGTEALARFREILAECNEKYPTCRSGIEEFLK